MILRSLSRYSLSVDSAVFTGAEITFMPYDIDDWPITGRFPSGRYQMYDSGLSWANWCNIFVVPTGR